MTNGHLGGENMINILTNNFFHAINTKNTRLLGYILDDNCILDDYQKKAVLGKEKVINYLTNLYKDYEISIVNSVRDDQDTVLLAYKLVKDDVPTFGSLVIRQNEHKKVFFIKNVIIDQN